MTPSARCQAIVNVGRWSLKWAKRQPVSGVLASGDVCASLWLALINPANTSRLPWMQVSAFQNHSHGHGHGHSIAASSDGTTPAETRVWAQARKHAVAQILELGIALHR